MEQKKCLVTGGNGFIGSHITNKLVDLGFEVYVICRRKNSNNPLFNKNLELGKIKIFNGSIQDFNYNNLPKDINLIIHTAGKVSAYGKMEDFMKTNYFATEKLLDFAINLKHLECFTYLSSTAVYGYYGYKNLKENGEKKPFKNPYSISKLKTEQLVEEKCKSHGMDFVIIRPGNVYGEYDYTSSYEIYSRVKHQKMSICAGGKYESCFVYAGNLADAIIHTSLKKSCHNTDYNVTDGNRDSLLHYLQLVSKTFKVKDKFINFPAPLAKMVASLVEGTYHLFRIKKAPLITKFSIWQNCNDYSFCIDKLKNTGFEIKTTPEEGIKKTVDWFNSIEKVKT